MHLIIAAVIRFKQFLVKSCQPQHIVSQQTYLTNMQYNKSFHNTIHIIISDITDIIKHFLRVGKADCYPALI